MEPDSAITTLREALNRRREVHAEAERIRGELAEVLAENRALCAESRELLGLDEYGRTKDQVAELIIALLAHAGLTAVQWDGGPLPILAPSTQVIQ